VRHNELLGFAHETGRRPHVIPALAAALLLLLALGDLPYGYYTFLRWAVCIAAVVVAWTAWKSAFEWATWPFVAIAIVFNPLVPIYLQRSAWQPIDVICSIAFALAIPLLTRLDETGGYKGGTAVNQSEDGWVWDQINRALPLGTRRCTIAMNLAKGGYWVVAAYVVCLFAFLAVCVALAAVLFGAWVFTGLFAWGLVPGIAIIVVITAWAWMSG
jgi:hypothetical protein